MVVKPDHPRLPGQRSPIDEQDYVSELRSEERKVREMTAPL
jgi:hypothetical protein